MKTPYFSKVYESFVCDWLMEKIQPYLDQDQFGMKGLSITHYLIKFLHFIQGNLDLSKPTAVIGAFVDMSKAFNRVDHNILIEDLYNMKCPPWLIRIVMSFLSNRVLIFSYKGASSTPLDLPGGGPQGTLLGCICFIIKFNGALLRPPVRVNPSLKLSMSTKAKYLDDSSVAVSIPLESLLEKDESRQYPLNFSERTKHILPSNSNLLQAYLEDIEKFN